MADQAHAKCTCGGEFTPLDDTPDLFKCQKCGKELHQVAGKHLDILHYLSDADDPEFQDLADSILSFKGGRDR